MRELANSMGTIEPNRVYLVQEVASLLRCGKTNVYDLISEGTLARTSIGAGQKGIRVMGSAVLAFLEARTEGGPRPMGSFRYLKNQTS